MLASLAYSIASDCSPPQREYCFPKEDSYK